MDYKPLRNKIRKYSYASFTRHLLNLLRNLEVDTSRPQAFWHPLLLLKWGLEFTGESYPPKEAELRDVINLIRQLEQLEQSHKTFNLRTNGRMSKSFSILAHQQFVYQEPVWLDTFSRQYVLYTKLRSRYDIDVFFTSDTGLTIQEMLTTLQFLWMLVFKNCIPEHTYYGTISLENWSVLIRSFGKEKARRIFDLLHVTRENFKTIVEADTRTLRNYNLQVFETSFFTRKPLFVFEEQVYVPHRDLLNYCASHFVYDYLKNRDPRFSEELGSRVEKYVELGLKENSISYRTENELRKEFGKDVPVVDFLIEGEILLEAKAIELKPSISVNPTDDLLASEFEHNIVKAYATQMLGIANRLKSNNVCYGIVLTYKELHLGDTNDIWEQFLEAETLKISADRSRMDRLPKENLFFVNLATWDKVMQIIKNTGITLKQVLVSAQRSALEKKFGFYMYLDEYKVTQYTLEYLKNDGTLTI